MKKYIGVFTLSCIIFAMSCNFFVRHHKQNVNGTERLNPCDTIKVNIVKYWQKDNQTKVYRCTNTKMIEKLIESYISCVSDTNNLTNKLMSVLGQPNEQSENNKGYYFIYYREEACFTLRTSIEYNSCDCYSISIDKKTNKVTIMLVSIVGTP